MHMLSHLTWYTLFIIDSTFLYLLHLHIYLFVESVYNLYFVKLFTEESKKNFLTSSLEVFRMPVPLVLISIHFSLFPDIFCGP